MIEKLILVKELRKKTLAKIIEKYGHGLGDLANMKLSIWDVKEILYSEAKKIASREMGVELEKW